MMEADEAWGDVRLSGGGHLSQATAAADGSGGVLQQGVEGGDPDVAGLPDCTCQLRAGVLNMGQALRQLHEQGHHLAVSGDEADGCVVVLHSETDCI